MSNEHSHLRNGQRSERLGKDPDDVRVVLPPPISQAEGNRMVSWRPVPAVGTVASEDRLERRKRLPDDLRGTRNFVLGCLAVDARHLSPPNHRSLKEPDRHRCVNDGVAPSAAERRATPAPAPPTG